MTIVRAFLTLAICSWAGGAAEPRKLIVIGIDGLDARYLKDADRLRLKIPVIRKLIKQGITADVTRTLPDNTWAASATIATGLRPEKHLILTSESPTQATKAETLWQAARTAHRRTALIYWPGTVAAEADSLCPQFWDGRFTVDPFFDPIAERCTPGLIQRIAGAYPAFVKAKWSDESGLQALRFILQSHQPDLAMVHLDDLAGEETETGALSIYSRAVLENDDDLIGQALEKRQRSTVVAIVSDHGFDTQNYIVRPKVLTGSNGIEVKNGLIGATDAKTAAALRKLAGNKKAGIAGEVPLADAKKIAPDAQWDVRWVAAFVTMPGFVASDASTGKGVGPGNRRGVPDAWTSRSALVLSGEGIQPGRLGEVSMLDIAPTLAEILGVRLSHATGKSLLPKR